MIRHTMHKLNNMFDTLWFVHSVEWYSKEYVVIPSIEIERVVFNNAVSFILLKEF